MIIQERSLAAFNLADNDLIKWRVGIAMERIFGKRPFKENFDQLGQEKSINIETDEAEGAGEESSTETTSESSEEAEQAVEEKK